MLAIRTTLRLLLAASVLTLAVPATADAQGMIDRMKKKAEEAAKAILATTYGVSAGRLTSVGFGDTKPIGPNTTAEGRQQNRRVELVK